MANKLHRSFLKHQRKVEMTATSLNLFYQTSQGPNDGLKDWYYQFKGKSGEHFVVHELNHMDMHQRTTRRQ